LHTAVTQLVKLKLVFILQYGLRNKSKSIKIIAEASSKGVSCCIFAYSYFVFDNVFEIFKHAEKKLKTLKKRYKRYLNRKRNKRLQHL